jgi:hypothetical protein
LNDTQNNLDTTRTDAGAPAALNEEASKATHTDPRNVLPTPGKGGSTGLKVDDDEFESPGIGLPAAEVARTEATGPNLLERNRGMPPV